MICIECKKESERIMSDGRCPACFSRRIYMDRVAHERHDNSPASEDLGYLQNLYS